MSMSLRRFEGWEAAEVHEHEYDDAGRLVRTIVTKEPEWDDEQRALMLALDQYERELCSGCGGHISSAFDPTVNRDVQSHEPRCLDCAAIEAKRRMDHKGHRGELESCPICAKRSVWVERHIPRA